MNNYYVVNVKFEKWYEVVVKANDETEAKEKAVRICGDDDVISAEVKAYDVNQLTKQRKLK